MIVGMNHFTITAENREATLGYYCGLLGFVEGARPDLGFPGSWLYAPGGRIVPSASASHSRCARSCSTAGVAT